MANVSVNGETITNKVGNVYTYNAEYKSELVIEFTTVAGYVFDTVIVNGNSSAANNAVNQDTQVSTTSVTYTVLSTDKGTTNSVKVTTKANTYTTSIIATDKIERQLLKHKQKVNSFIKKREGISDYFSNLESNEEDKEEKSAVKVKVIESEVMTLDEAITNLELTLPKKLSTSAICDSSSVTSLTIATRLSIVLAKSLPIASDICVLIFIF